VSAALLRNDQGNAFNALANLARRASSGALVSLETTGLVLALGIYAWTPRRWPFILPCVALTAYGLWGMCDRFIESRSGRRYITHRRIFRTLARIIAALGIAAALGGVYLLMGWAMGVYIS
jgi:hypothetical protein